MPSKLGKLMLAKFSTPSMTNPKLTTNDITILKGLVAMLSRSNTSVQDLEALLLARAAPGPSSQPQAGTHTSPTMPITPSTPDEDTSFYLADIADGVVNNFSNNNNGRPDNQIYTPPVRATRAFHRSFIRGGSVVSNHSNNNNAQGSVTNPMVIEYSRNPAV